MYGANPATCEIRLFSVLSSQFHTLCLSHAALNLMSVTRSKLFLFFCLFLVVLNESDCLLNNLRIVSILCTQRLFEKVELLIVDLLMVCIISIFPP